MNPFNYFRIKRVVVGLCLMALMAKTSSAFCEVRGSVGLDTRYFAGQTQLRASSFLDLELYSQKNQWNFVVHPYARVDADGSRRNHVDVREFYAQYAGDVVEFKVGLDRIFWGVTESQHLVDVINQSDGLEGIDSEDKLGQPMLQTTVKSDYGVLDVFVLPYFRERKYAQGDEPLNIHNVIAGSSYYAHINNDALYESGAEQHHLDMALRYSHTLGNLDVGISYFKGTARDPSLQPTGIDASQRQFNMTAFYPQMQQWGWDAQYTQGAWLFKWESVYRRAAVDRISASVDSITASTIGFEYTWFGVSAKGADVGALVEYSRHNQPLLAANWSDHDVFIGSRLTLNDEQSSELLLGVMVDEKDTQSYSGRLEASRRWSDNFKVSLEAWLFHFNEADHPLKSLNGDDFIQLGMEFFY